MFGGMELWSPPRDAPHLFEWWRPLVQASRRARAERVPWPVHVDEFRLAGRVIRRHRPDVWIYEHHANGGSLCLDAAGGAYRFVVTPGGGAGDGAGAGAGGAGAGGAVGQFRRCALVDALRRAGLPDVVERVTYARPAAASHPGAPTRPAGPAGGSVAGGSARVIRRGHLTLVAGCA